MAFALKESRGTKPGVFPCNVAPAGDERYLGCVAGAGPCVFTCVGSSSVFCNDW